MHRILISSVLVLCLAACKENTADTKTALPPADTQSAQTIQEEDTTVATVQKNGSQEMYNERFRFYCTIPATYTVSDKSNNGDGYYIQCGDAGTDIRVYGESLTDNPLAAELALKGCERTEKFRFANGYPGLLCFQSGDRYYYYDTPNTRITLYVHADARWFERNEATILQIAQSIRIE